MENEKVEVNMKERTKNYFILAEQYLETSKLLLDILISNENSNGGIGDSETEAEETRTKNVLKSDVILFVPAIFNSYQSIELILKGLLLLNNDEIFGNHEVSQMLYKLKTIYGEKSDIYKEIKMFYKGQIDIINEFKKNNKISTTKELYEALRYPENKSENAYKKKFYDYSELKYNGKEGREKFKLLRKKISRIKEIILKEFNDKY